MASPGSISTSGAISLNAYSGHGNSQIIYQSIYQNSRFFGPQSMLMIHGISFCEGNMGEYL